MAGSKEPSLGDGAGLNLDLVGGEFLVEKVIGILGKVGELCYKEVDRLDGGVGFGWDGTGFDGSGVVVGGGGGGHFVSVFNLNCDPNPGCGATFSPPK